MNLHPFRVGLKAASGFQLPLLITLVTSCTAINSAQYAPITCDFDLDNVNLTADCERIALQQPDLADLMLKEAIAFRLFDETLQRLERARDAATAAERDEDDGVPPFLWSLRRDLYEKYDLLGCRRSSPTLAEYVQCLTQMREKMSSELRGMV